MAIEQVSRNAKALNTSTIGGDVSNTYVGTSITTLRTNIAANNIVSASDVNLVITLINNWLGHYHTYDDYYQRTTYGNTGDGIDYLADQTTTSSLGAAIDGVANTDTIQAAKHNSMVTKITSLSTHSHGITDRDTI